MGGVLFFGIIFFFLLFEGCFGDVKRVRDKGGYLGEAGNVGQEAMETSLSHAKFHHASIIYFLVLFAVKFSNIPLHIYIFDILKIAR
jgi:hypothetical protein